LEDGAYFGEIPRFKDVWANTKTLETCRTELKEVLEDWLLLRIRGKEKIPGLNIKVDRRNLVKHA